MRKSRIIILFLLAFSVCIGISNTTFAQDEIMTNDEVISLTKAGLSGPIIANKIRTSKTNFDMSTDALIKLKQAGVSDETVTAMLEAKSGKSMPASATANAAAPGDPNDPLTKHGYGVYLFEEKNGVKKMTQISPSVSAQNRTGGLFTNSLTYGIGKIKVKANLPGKTAKTQIDQTQPVFYFYLDSNTGGLNTSSGIPSTPNEFALVRFNVRSDNREVTIGKTNAFGSKGGLSDEYVVDFVAEDLGNGVFRIAPKITLKNGEYAFYLINSGNSNASTAVGSKFFDFGVRLTP